MTEEVVRRVLTQLHEEPEVYDSNKPFQLDSEESEVFSIMIKMNLVRLNSIRQFMPLYEYEMIGDWADEIMNFHVASEIMKS